MHIMLDALTSTECRSINFTKVYRFSLPHLPVEPAPFDRIAISQTLALRLFHTRQLSATILQIRERTETSQKVYGLRRGARRWVPLLYAARRGQA